MDPVLYSAVDGGTNDQVRQDIIANNLANINTPGFKADLYQAQIMYQTDQNGVAIPNAQTFIIEEPSTIDISPGPIQTTGRDLDIAINGNGFLAVQAPDGSEAYTRGGSFHIDPNGQLINASGYPVLGDGGPISIPPARTVEIGGDGTISIAPLDGVGKTLAVIDRIKTVSLNVGQITRTPEGLIRPTQAGAVETSTKVQVVGRALEGSNVNAIDQMVQMISASRDFDGQIKIMATVDEDAQKLAQLLQ